MPSKFSKPRLTKPAFIGCGVALALCFGVGGGPAGVRAQQSTPNRTTSPNGRKAHIRFWNMLTSKPTNTLLLLAGERDSLCGAGAGDIYAEYLPAPAGSYTLMVKRASPPTTVIAQLPVVLPEKGFLTVVASEKNGQPTAEVFNDTPDPRVTELSGQIVVRQFCPSVHITVGLAAGKSSRTVEYGAAATLEDIPLNGPVGINVQATASTTPPSIRNWTFTGDFSTAHHATLIVAADPYGRPQPQLSYDAWLKPIAGAAPAASPAP